MWGRNKMVSIVPIEFVTVNSPLPFLPLSPSFSFPAAFLFISFLLFYQSWRSQRESCNAFFHLMQSFISRLCLNEGFQTLKQLLSSSPENNQSRFQNLVSCNLSRRKRGVSRAVQHMWACSGACSRDPCCLDRAACPRRLRSWSSWERRAGPAGPGNSCDMWRRGTIHC